MDLNQRLLRDSEIISKFHLLKEHVHEIGMCLPLAGVEAWRRRRPTSVTSLTLPPSSALRGTLHTLPF